MAVENQLAQAIQQLVHSEVSARAPLIKTAIWVSAETIDANLSVISIEGTTFRYVPKLSGVSPSNGQTVVVIGGVNTTLFIAGILVGDTTKAGL